MHMSLRESEVLIASQVLLFKEPDHKKLRSVVGINLTQARLYIEPSAAALIKVLIPYAPQPARDPVISDLYNPVKCVTLTGIN